MEIDKKNVNCILLINILSSSVVEQSAVNRFAVGSNPTWGETFLNPRALGFARYSIPKCLADLLCPKPFTLFFVSRDLAMHSPTVYTPHVFLHRGLHLISLRVYVPNTPHRALFISN